MFLTSRIIFNLYSMVISLINLNLFLSFSSLLITTLIFYFSKHSSVQQYFKNLSSLLLIRKLLTISMLFSFFLHLMTIISYITFVNYHYNFCLINNEFFLPEINLNINIIIFSYPVTIFFSIDMFGLILLFLAYVVGFFSLLALDTRLY